MIRLWQEGDETRLRWIDRLRGPAFHWSVVEIERLRSSHEIWVWEEAGEAVAWVALQKLPDAWEVTALATHPNWTRRGFMRKLLEPILDSKQQDGEVWLEVHEENQAARALYQALNFQEVGRRPRYYSDGAAAVLMTRK